VLSVHIHGNSSQSIKPLQMALRSGGAANIVQSSKDLEHGGKCNRTHFDTKALMSAKAKVSVQAHITVKTDLIWIGECNRVTACNNLYFARLINIRRQRKARVSPRRALKNIEHTKLQMISWPAFRVIFSPLSSTTVGLVTKRGNATEHRSLAPSIKLHTVSIPDQSTRRWMKYLLSYKKLISFRGVLPRQTLDLDQMLCGFFREVVVKTLGEELALIGNQCTSRGEDM
jgi:hypothetical protein